MNEAFGNLIDTPVATVSLYCKSSSLNQEYIKEPGWSFYADGMRFKKLKASALLPEQLSQLCQVYENLIPSEHRLLYTKGQNMNHEEHTESSMYIWFIKKKH